MTTPKTGAGGRATEAGMSFQAAVGTWFAAHLVSDMPLGSRFGISADARPTELQFETGHGLDDIAVRLTGDCAVYVQCKTRVDLETSPNSGLAKTIGQLVQFYVDAERSGAPPEPQHVATVLAVAENASQRLNDLEAACRAFDFGGDWSQTVGQLPQGQRSALEVFAKHVRAAWRAKTGTHAQKEDLRALARLFRIRRFGEGAASASWSEASNLIGSRLFGGEDAGGPPTAELLNTMRQLMRSGAIADRPGLLRALRAAGHTDTKAPGFDADIDALRKYSSDECERLARHTCLPIGAGVPIHRACLPALDAAIAEGSLLVTGEPGAGKTGALVRLAGQFAQRTVPLVFLSEERLIGLRNLADLRAALGIKHDLIDVLAAWPGTEPGVLIIDALDASRGDASEAVIATLVEHAVARLGERWSVIASIRTFDLLNGRKFREAMRGMAPDHTYIESGLEQVRHFRIPRLSNDELHSLGSKAPTLSKLIDDAPPTLRTLLQNIFNLSLAAELIERGVSPNSIRTLTTQSELIDRYEDERLPTQAQKLAAADTIAAMVKARRLTVPQINVRHDALDELLQRGVLVRAGELVAFAHHVLFDHVAGRFYLEWSQPALLQQQISGDAAVGLLLGPALRFAIERVWRLDTPDRRTSWNLIRAIMAAPDADPIVASIALRTLTERVGTVEDVGGLINILQTNADTKGLSEILSRLARFVSMNFSEGGTIPRSVAIAWAQVAAAATAQARREYTDGPRFFLATLMEHADFGDPELLNEFGQAARALLQLAWSLDPEIPFLTTSAIRFVAKSFGSDPAASRALLRQILEEPRFIEHAHEEAPWLAEGIRTIIPHDPQFASFIYATLYGREAPQDGKTWLGGHRSQILPLTSDRKQEYEHARYYLGRALKTFLQADTRAGVSAVIGATSGLIEMTARRREQAPGLLTVEAETSTVRVVDDLLSLQDWRVKQRAADREDDILATFTDFLKTAPPSSFHSAVEVAMTSVTGAAVWARLLGIAADRRGIADDLLWPLAREPKFTSIRGLARDAIIYIAALYPTLSRTDRAKFETTALAEDLFTEEASKKWWRSLLARLLSSIETNDIATSAMKLLRSELDAKKRLVGNPAFLSIQTGYGNTDDITERLLERGGADLTREPDHSVRVASRALEDQLKRDTEANTPSDLTEIWMRTQSLVYAIDQVHDKQPNPETLHAAWGAVSNAVERIALNSGYDPSLGELPDLDGFLALIERLMASPYPEARDQGTNRMMGWGNWDVRVYAASSTMALAKRYAVSQPRILDLLKRCLSDPVATVRLQVAQSVNALWDVARSDMWALAALIARNETNTGVLGFFISGPLQRLAGAEPERTEGLMATILSRLSQDRRDKEERDHIGEAAGPLTALLFVKYESQNAWKWIERWCEGLISGEPYLWSLLHSIRGAFFLGYQGGETGEQRAMRQRAHAVLNLILSAASAAMRTAEPILRDETRSDDERKESEALYIAGERLIDQCCNQLYFGSGAFRPQSDSDEPRLDDKLEKRRFLSDYGAALNQIGMNGSPRTIHHLIELYASLVEANPADIFDRISDILVGHARDQQYQYESLGADALVALIRRYLADHRGIFEDGARRARLVEVLELFSSVGWPDALKLLYELPDLLR